MKSKPGQFVVSFRVSEVLKSTNIFDREMYVHCTIVYFYVFVYLDIFGEVMLHVSKIQNQMVEKLFPSKNPETSLYAELRPFVMFMALYYLLSRTF